MYMKEQVRIPDEKGRINTLSKGGSSYVRYLVESVYIPEKKYAIPKFVNIGKLSDTPGMMFPNENYVKYFGRDELPEESSSGRSGCIRYGTFLVLSQTERELGIRKILERWVSPSDAGLLIDLAFYAVVTEHMQGQYYPFYAYDHPLMTEGMKAYSDAKVSDLLSSVTADQIQGFLNDWNEGRDREERIYISYDSTNKNCQAGDIEMLEYGHAKNDAGLPVVNVAMAYDVRNEQPLFYEQYPGSIVDVSQLRYMVKKAEGYGYRNIGFILDRGYFSMANIHELDRAGYPFIMMVKGCRKLVSGIIDEVRGTFEHDRGCFMPRYRSYGTTVRRRLYPSDSGERYFHVYYSQRKAASEAEALECRLDAMRDCLESARGTDASIGEQFSRYFHIERHEDGTFVCASERGSIIERELSMMGYYCIITSEPMSARDALEIYKGRDVSEKLFRTDKSFIGANAVRVHSGESMRTRMFVEFLALVLRNRIHVRLRSAEASSGRRMNYMNVPAAVRELEKMQLLRDARGDYVIDHATTRMQKTILGAFGIDANVLKKLNAGICRKLKEADGSR